ncbi:MAG: hypothetical protein ACJA0H_001502 [Francisellaceae bacterium]|jgi:uncharacterized protein (DUF2147 family)
MKKIVNIFLSTLFLIFVVGAFAAPTGKETESSSSVSTAAKSASDSIATKVSVLGSGVKDGKLVGKSYWATVSDDEVDGKKVIQSIIEIYSNDSGVATGKVFVPFTKIEDEEAEVPSLICTECEGNLKDKPIIGLQIMNAKITDGKTYKGNIIDPTSGKDYTLKMWLSDNDNVLNARGYIVFFYRTQNWYHVDGKVAQSCSTWFAKQAYAKNSRQEKDNKKLSDDKYTFFSGGSESASEDLIALCK